MELLDIYGLSQEEIANHLTAFFCAKKSLGKQFTKKSTKTSKTDVEFQNYKQRIAVIGDLANEVRDLLYNYNKDCLNKFMKKVENILLLELFLCEQNEFFATQQQNVNGNAHHLNHQEFQQQAVVATRRKQKQLEKNAIQYLKFDHSHKKHWYILEYFTDYFSPKKTQLKCFL